MFYKCCYLGGVFYISDFTVPIPNEHDPRRRTGESGVIEVANKIEISVIVENNRSTRTYITVPLEDGILRCQKTKCGLMTFDVVTDEVILYC